MDLHAGGDALDEAVLVLVRQVLERAAHRLRDQQRREHAREHEEREDLENVLHEVVRAADVLQPRKPDLRDDRAELARRGRNAVRRRAVARRERLAGDDERRRVRAEVLEEVREAVEEDECLVRGRRRGELVVREAHDGEEDGEDGEAHELDGLAAPGVDEEERCVVTRDKTCS